jgi:phosphinothricin acetyltransferase
MSVTIEVLQPGDWSSIQNIYAHGIAGGQATFESAVPGWEKWHAAHLPSCRLVAREGGAVLGWAALSPVSSRSVYSGVAAESVYVAADQQGKGVGRLLLESLIRASEAHGIWTLNSGIFPENEASLQLHKSCGFRIVGVQERIGRTAGVWRDIVLMERRSSIAGV